MFLFFIGFIPGIVCGFAYTIKIMAIMVKKSNDYGNSSSELKDLGGKLKLVSSRDRVKVKSKKLK